MNKITTNKKIKRLFYSIIFGVMIGLYVASDVGIKKQPDVVIMAFILSTIVGYLLGDD